MRCLALADELARRGADVTFATRAAPGPWRALVEGRGHRLAALNAQAPNWVEDARETQGALHEVPDWLVVDHYALPGEWEDAMRTHAAKILAIDDLGRAHSCDLLLDQNVVSEAPAASEHQLFGPRFALLRPEFARARLALAQRDGRCRNVLISFGASDPTDETGRAIEAFLMSGLAAKAVIVLGAGNPQAAMLRARYGSHPLLELIDSSDRVAELMAAADLAVGAGGVSTWERATVGLPSLVIGVADNQIGIAERLAALGSQIYLGRSGDVDAAQLGTALGVVGRNRGLLTSLARISAALCDGLGARRVADHMIAPRISLRRAAAADAAALHSWRNAEAVRQVSSNPAPVTLAQHERWLAAVLTDANRHLLIGEDVQGPVGVVRFDVTGNRANISIYLVPQRIGSGMGLQLLMAAQEWLALQVPAAVEITARVLAENRRSAAMFESAGYRLAEHEYRKPLKISRTP